MVLLQMEHNTSTCICLHIVVSNKPVFYFAVGAQGGGDRRC